MEEKLQFPRFEYRRLDFDIVSLLCSAMKQNFVN